VYKILIIVLIVLVAISYCMVRHLLNSRQEKIMKV